ncbi:MAG: glycoside hydrolase family 11 protein [Fibrobacteraceae bacterium]|nr:glycoside hydrolase family 11 protein [Fibrobacteraceae bacterium]
MNLTHSEVTLQGANMTHHSNSLKFSLSIILGLAISSYAQVDACTETMGHTGNGTTITNNQTGSISGTPWGFEIWYDGGNNSMTYYNNGTFKAQWSGSNDFLARVGYRYGDNGPGIDHNDYHFTVDYKYTKQSQSAGYGYIGVYGWTVNPQVEYYIVDDWYSKPNTQYIGDQFGEITVDGAKYTIHAFLRQEEPSKTGTSTFLQIFSVRQTPRQCGHIDISAHFKKWEEIFTGQTETLKGSKGGGSATLKFGKVTEVMLMNEAGGNASGSVDYTYFNMSDNGTPSEIVPPKDIPRQPYNGVKAKIPGTIEAENFDEGNEGVSYAGATGSSGSDGLDYRGEDYFIDIVGCGNGACLGYTAANEWVEYTVDVLESGEYDIEAYVSNGSGSGTVELALDGKALVSLPFTGTADDWNAYESATGKASLTAGEHVLRVTIATANTNLDYVKFTLPGYTPPAEDPSAIATTLRLNAVGKTYQVFDMQGRSLGQVDVVNGSSISDALFNKFQKTGLYIVKQGSLIQKVKVSR